MVKKWGASRLKLPHSEVAGCPTDWAMEFSHGPLTQVVKYICASPTVCPCHYRVSCILTDLSVVLMSVWLVVLACCVDSCHSLVRDGLRSVSYMDVAHISPIDPCWRSPLIGLVQLIWLGRCCGIFRGSVAWRGCFSSVKSQFRSDGRSLSTWHRRILQIVTTWRLEDDTWTMERIGIRCLLAESLPSVLMFLTGGGVIPNTWMLEPHPGMVSLDRRMFWMGSEVVTALCISLLEKGTPSVVPTVRCLHVVLVFPCLDLLAVVACLILVIIQLTLVLVVQSSKICIFWSSSDDMAVSVCHCLFTRQQGQPRECGLSTAILSVTFSWHTASTL